MELLTIIGTDETEELYIEIPESIIQKLGWDEGTEIDWQIDQESIILSKSKIEDTTMSKRQVINPNVIIEEEVKHYLESESEGKDYDQIYDEYINSQTHQIQKDY
tara:strand:- start:1183 stop:1497 length:315 start_codon:yes stop_codon:yes gene_type:complete